MRAIKAKTDIVVDLAELSWADVSLMLDLAMLARRLRTQGCTMALRDAQPHVVVLLELVGLNRLPGVRVEHSTPVAALA